jgi:hypothetical protein
MLPPWGSTGRAATLQPREPMSHQVGRAGHVREESHFLWIRLVGGLRAFWLCDGGFVYTSCSKVILCASVPQVQVLFLTVRSAVGPTGADFL